MTDNVYLNQDKTAVVPESALGKKWQVPRKVAIEMGLLDGPAPKQDRRLAPKAETNGTPQKRRSSNKGLNRGLNEDT